MKPGRDMQQVRRGRHDGSSALGPGRVGLALLAAVISGWLIAAGSLPYALSSASPEIALRLDPGNPEALLSKLNGVREKWLNSASKDQELAKEESAKDGRLPGSAEAGLASLEADRLATKQELISLASRLRSSDPLNSRAFLVLAEQAETRDKARTLMVEAERRSRRETAAVFWLLVDSFDQRNFNAALGHADTILRTRPQLNTYALSFIAQIATDASGRAKVVELLAAKPAWRSQFFEVLPGAVQDFSAPLEIMSALQASSAPPKADEVLPYLNALINKGHGDFAYNVWLKLIRPEGAKGGFVFNPSFEEPASGLPFEWRFGQSLNAVIEIAQSPNGAEGKSLHIIFGSGRVRLAEVNQIVFLPSGRFRVEGRYKGSIVSRRGLRWQFRCLYGARQVINQTEQIIGTAKDWKTFGVEFEVPDTSECKLQQFRLFHDARSASEEFISGEAWFDDLQILPLP